MTSANRTSTRRAARRAAAFATIFFAAAHAARADVTGDVIADFDGGDYAGWTATGDAFGNGPATGSLPEQMSVNGWMGGGFANSYHNTDRGQGTLTSPPFTISKDFIAFLVGGGSHAGKTCVNLLVENKVVMSTTGSNDEHLDWDAWDVKSLRGKQARIQIVDREAGGWGHILVDQIMQTDQPPAAPIVTSPLYRETHRPQFHFTAANGWLNDPNGLVFYAGEYHLFFQHNPKGTEWGNMTWGHATSPDLLHWTQRPNAILPDKLGTIFSGSAVVDWDNTAGFAKGPEKTLVAMYTAAGGTNPESRGQPFTQCIAYSNDKGRTWIKYDKNPVIGHIVHENRDPKVIWHEPTKRWICALYLDGSKFALFSSPDLKAWTRLQEIEMPGASECPDFFPLPLDGNAGKQKWVLTAADARYLVGDFDGNTFKPETTLQQGDFGNGYYAVQTYSDTPDGRRIQIAWMRNGKYPHMPFNQQMSFPTTLDLKSTPEGPRLFRNPIKEIATLHEHERSWTDLALNEGENPLAEFTGDLFHITATIEPGSAKSIAFIIRGQRVGYDVAEQKLSALGDAKVPLVNGQLRLEILVDRTTIETFANGGQAAMSSCFLPKSTQQPPLALFAEGGDARIVSLSVATLKSAWPSDAKAPTTR